MITSRKYLPAALALVLLHLFWAAPSRGTTFTVNPFSDAFVTTGPSGNLSGNNYGGAGAIGVSAPGLAKGEFQSLLQFDLTAARTSFDAQFGAGQWSVQSATLQMTATLPNNAIFNATSAGQFQVYWMQNDSWTEGTGTPNAPTTTGITFATLPNFASAADESLGTLPFNGATSGAANYALNVTPGFNADILAGSDITLRLLAADSSVSGLFDSRSFGTVGARPLLTIDVVPEPGTMALAGLGIILLAGWRMLVGRRRG